MSFARDDEKLPPILSDADWGVDFELVTNDAGDPLDVDGSSWSLVFTLKGRRRPAEADVHELTTDAGEGLIVAGNVVAAAWRDFADWTPGDYDVELRKIAGASRSPYYVGEITLARGLSDVAELGGGGPLPATTSPSVRLVVEAETIRIVRGEAAGTTAAAVDAAERAEAAATSAEDDAAATAADRVQTGLDRTAVHDDRLAADADAAATAADRIAVHADKLAADADAAATAADRTAVHADKLAADADAAATAADRIAVHADKLAADADAAATPADRVQTGLDRTAVHADKLAADADAAAAASSEMAAENALAAILGGALNAAAGFLDLTGQAVAGTLYTITDADNGKLLAFTSATPVTVWVDSLSAGFRCGIMKAGAGDVGVRPGIGGAAAPNDLLTVSTQYGCALLRQIFGGLHVLQGGDAELPDLGPGRFIFNRAGASGLLYSTVI